MIVFPSWTHNPGRMVFTLYKDGSLLKTSLLDVYNCLCYPIGRTLRPSVECPGGTFYPSGGQFALVQNVRGDIVHYCRMSWGTFCTGGQSALPHR